MRKQLKISPILRSENLKKKNPHILETLPLAIVSTGQEAKTRQQNTLHSLYKLQQLLPLQSLIVLLVLLQKESAAMQSSDGILNS